MDCKNVLPPSVLTKHSAPTARVELGGVDPVGSDLHPRGEPDGSRPGGASVAASKRASPSWEPRRTCFRRRRPRSIPSRCSPPARSANGVQVAPPSVEVAPVCPPDDELVPTRATMSGAPSAKSRLVVLPKIGLANMPSGGETSRCVVLEPADVAHAAQQRRARRRAGEIEHHGLFEAAVVERPVRRRAAVRHRDVVARPEALPGDEERVRRIEGIDLDVAHPAHRRQAAAVPVEPLRAGHLPLRRLHERRPARAAVRGPVDLARRPEIDRRDDAAFRGGRRRLKFRRSRSRPCAGLTSAQAPLAVA